MDRNKIAAAFYWTGCFFVVLGSGRPFGIAGVFISAGLSLVVFVVSQK